MQENTPALWKIPPLAAEDHKYRRGHVLVYGGDTLTGASRLAALAALRTGAGLVTLAAPRSVWPLYATSLLSVITRPLAGAQDWQALLEDARITVVILGPGAGVDMRLHQALTSSLAANKKLLLDADALTLLARDASLRQQMQGKDVILTPHAGEYEKLAGALRLETGAHRARALATALGVTVLLKGAETVIANAAGQERANHHAPPWLATAGTGDVLAGMIAGLWAQGMTAFDAASAGAWLHAEAALRRTRGLIAEDLLAEIPATLEAAGADISQTGCS